MPRTPLNDHDQISDYHQQMLLDVILDPPATFANFISGRNQALIENLQHMAMAVSTQMVVPENRFIYIWGEMGSGKTHLLSAVAHLFSHAQWLQHTLPLRHKHRSSDVQLSLKDTGSLPMSKWRGVYLIDDCHQLTAVDQQALFALFNCIREAQGWLIMTGAYPPAGLTNILREDVRTRLAWGLVYQLFALNDEEKIAALNQAAQARCLKLSEGVLPYLIRHHSRDMHSLFSTLDALNRYSLETQRAITVPLLQAFFRREAHA